MLTTRRFTIKKKKLYLVIYQPYLRYEKQKTRHIEWIPLLGNSRSNRWPQSTAALELHGIRKVVRLTLYSERHMSQYIIIFALVIFSSLKSREMARPRQILGITISKELINISNKLDIMVQFRIFHPTTRPLTLMLYL